MNNGHNYAWIGAVACFLPAALLLLAGSGRRKLARGAAISLTLPLLAAAPAAPLALNLARSSRGGRGNEWAPLGDLFWAVLAFAVVFAIVFGITVWRQLASKRMTLERAPKSRPLLVLGVLAAWVWVLCVVDVAIGFNPRAASPDRLVQQLDNQFSPAGAELVRRGPPAVPAIVAALHLPGKPNEPGYIASGRKALLIRVLGQIGGPEASAELRRWIGKDLSAEVRAVALDGLASQGDRSVIPIIVEMLGGGARRPELFHALGTLQAAEQVSLIRSILLKDPISAFASIRPGVAALAAIDTDEAWQVISKVAAHQDASLASETMVALQECHGPRTIAFLGRMLDDPDKKRSQQAYETLYWADRSLFPDFASRSWSAANVAKVRAVLQARGLIPKET